ncbi:MAG TPA: hypothetical protein VGM39_16030 [Kofleriaceae bacterium]|jgi:ribosomal protein S27AE
MTQLGDVVDCVERECPRCRAIVFFATTDDPGTTCTACSSRPYPARRPRVVPVPDPVAEPMPDTDATDNRRVTHIVLATLGTACVAALALGGVVIFAVTVLCSAGILAAATRRRPALNGADD